MNKNILYGIIAVLIIALGAWFYFNNHNSPTSTLGTGETHDTTGIDNVTDDSNQSSDMADMANNDTTAGNPCPNTHDVDSNLAVDENGLDHTKLFDIKGSNFCFSMNKIQVKKGDTVRVTFSSASGMHNFVINEFNVATRVLRATDAPQTVEFVADKVGQFEFYCSVGTHRQMGMVGKLTVTE